jgi:fructuronate reductase
MLDDGRMPHLLALTAAAYLSCVAPLNGFDPGAQAEAMEDPARGLLAGLAARSGSGQELAERALRDHHLLGDGLAERTEFIERTGQLVDTIHSSGPLAAIADASDPSPRPHAATRSTS